MKKYLFVLVLICFSAISYAREVLLDCNLPDGDTQQVVVAQEAGALTLEDLDTRGDWSRRPLSAAEWSSKKLHLKTESGAKAVLYFDGGDWWFSYKSPGYNASGRADCSR